MVGLICGMHTALCCLWPDVHRSVRDAVHPTKEYPSLWDHFGLV